MVERVELTYTHNRKAGNLGDVWKHYALARILIDARSKNVAYYVETHAGAGLYELEERFRGREWGRAIARVAERTEVTDEPFQSVLKQVNPSLKFPGPYPGSAFVANRLLHGCKHVLFEVAQEVAACLRAHIPEADVRPGDGYTGLLGWFERERQMESHTLVFLDPPYLDDWQKIPEVLDRLRGWMGGTTIAIWYPVFAYSNPDRLWTQCCRLGTTAWKIECVVDKPKAKPSQKLKGSGLLILNAQNRQLYEDLVGLAERLAYAMQLEGELPDTSRHSWLEKLDVS